MNSYKIPNKCSDCKFFKVDWEMAEASCIWYDKEIKLPNILEETEDLEDVKKPKWCKASIVISLTESESVSVGAIKEPIKNDSVSSNKLFKEMLIGTSVGEDIYLNKEGSLLNTALGCICSKKYYPQKIKRNCPVHGNLFDKELEEPKRVTKLKCTCKGFYKDPNCKACKT